jgi:hypothetical protein
MKRKVFFFSFTCPSLTFNMLKEAQTAASLHCFSPAVVRCEALSFLDLLHCCLVNSMFDSSRKNGYLKSHLVKTLSYALTVSASQVFNS